MGHAAFTPIHPSFTANTPPRPQKRIYLAPPSSHSHSKETLKPRDFPKFERSKSKDYSQLFGKPGSALFGYGTANGLAQGGGAGGQLQHELDASAWAPPLPLSFDASVRDSEKEEEGGGMAGLGYFAFPPSGPANAAKPLTNASPSSASESATQNATPSSSPNAQLPSSSSSRASLPSPSSPEADAWDPTAHLTALHTARLAREALEAQKGEEYWVSCGGVLRDSLGRRDLERTKHVREAVERREREREVARVWEEYERRWGEMVRRVWEGARGRRRRRVKREANDGDVMDEEDGDEEEEEDEGYLGFYDVPWPVHIAFTSPPPPPTRTSPASPLRISQLSFKAPSPQPPASSPYPPPPERILAELTPANIRKFLLDPLSVRSPPGTGGLENGSNGKSSGKDRKAPTPKERIRSSMLRWHPDKMGPVIEKVREGEREAVVRGVHEVVRALRGLMGEVGRESGRGG